MTTAIPAWSQSRPAAPQAFRPGVRIDWAQRSVLVDAISLQQQGPLEFVACWGGKEHESLVRIRPSAADVYMALGLLGFEAGQPPKWSDDDGYSAPSGDLIDVRVRWNAADGPREESMFHWVRERAYGQDVVPLPWVYSGSLRGPGPTLQSDRSGAGFAVVDQPDSFLQLDLRYSSQDAMLWLAAHPERVPSPGAPVTLVLKRAEVRRYTVQLTPHGDLLLDGQRVPPQELALRIQLNRRIDPTYRQAIEDRALLQADRLRLVRVLQAELPQEAWSLQAR